MFTLNGVDRPVPIREALTDQALTDASPFLNPGPYIGMQKQRQLGDRAAAA